MLALLFLLRGINSKSGLFYTVLFSANYGTLDVRWSCFFSYRRCKTDSVGSPRCSGSRWPRDNPGELILDRGVINLYMNYLITEFRICWAWTQTATHPWSVKWFLPKGVSTTASTRSTQVFWSHYLPRIYRGLIMLKQELDISRMRGCF